MGYLTLHVFLLTAISTIATAYTAWTVTHYFEPVTASWSEITGPCTFSTRVVSGSTTAPHPTDCPGFATTNTHLVEITPTTPLQGTSATTVTNVFTQYDPNFTVYEVYVELSLDEVPFPSTTTIPSTATTGIALPTLNFWWEVNNTKLQFVQPVLFTAPASCKPGADTTYWTTWTHSSYSFTSLVSLDVNQEIIGDIVPQLAAAATSTGMVTEADYDQTTTLIQYILPSNLFPVESPYNTWSSIDPCIDPRPTPTQITTSRSSAARIKANYQQAFILAVLAAAAVAGE